MIRLPTIWLLICIPVWVYGQGKFIAPCETLQEVRELFNQDEIELAAQRLNQFEAQSEICQSEHLLLMGNLYLYQRDYPAAQQHFRQALEGYRVSNTIQGVVRSNYFLALAMIEGGQPEGAIPYLEEALEAKSALSEVELLDDVLDLRAMLFSNQGQHEEAMGLLKEALRYALTSEDSLVQSRLLNQIATNYQSLGAIDSAVLYYARLIEVKTGRNDRPGLISDYSTLGGLYRELGSYTDAQSAFIQAIGHAEVLGDSLSLVGIYINIAQVYLAQSLFEPALEYTEKALELARINQMLLSQGQSLSLQGEILEAYHQSDSAATIAYRQALAIYLQLDLKQQSANIQVKLAEINPSDTQLEKAESALRELLMTRRASGDKIGELNTLLLLCDILLKLERQPAEVEQWLKQSEVLARETGNARSLQEVFRLKSLQNQRAGNYRRALLQYQAFKTIQDSILNQDNAREVRRLEKQYQTVKRDIEEAKLNAAIEDQKNALRLRNTQILILLVGIALLVGLIVLIVYLNRRNKLLNEQRLSILEKERETDILRGMVAGEEQERLRIARDLHDGLGALMATIKMRISALGHELPELNEQENYQTAEALVDEAYHSVREVSHNMVPGSIRKFGLEQAIAHICESIEQTHPLKITYIPYQIDQLDNDLIATNVYRITQELLQNTLKHAEATEVIVQLTLEDHLFMIVEDNGKGFEMPHLSDHSGLGLGSVRSRVLFLNGTLEVDSTPGEGTTFSIDIPIPSSSSKISEE